MTVQESEKYQDFEYCSECGEPAIHNAFGNSLCNNCKKTDTLVVSLIGGPGCGKSTTRAGIFHGLKLRGIDCEEATEYAKDLTWEKRQFTLNNQIHVFGEQHHRIWKLLGQVKVIITDSPILLTPIYDREQRSSLHDLVLSEFWKMRNYVVFLKREKPYNQNGRNQTESESFETDLRILDFLDDNNIPYETFPGNDAGTNKIIDKILKLI